MRRDRTRPSKAPTTRNPQRKKPQKVKRYSPGFDRRYLNWILAVGMMAGLIVLSLYAWRTIPPRIQETGCITKLRQISQGLTMYGIDHEADPPVNQFPWALYPYIRDADSRATGESAAEPGMGRGLNGGASPSPTARKLFVCPADRREEAYNSYLLVDRRNFPPRSQQMNVKTQPWVVDELFHQNKVPILYRDGHVEALAKDTYLQSTRPLFNIRQPGEGYAR